MEAAGGTTFATRPYVEEIVPRGERYVSRVELARIMAVSVATIDRFVREGMPSETWGMRARRFLPSRALAWAQTRERRAS
jgi:phage terminase Nu1 subunit (DNA packaging protein)